MTIMVIHGTGILHASISPIRERPPYNNSPTALQEDRMGDGGSTVSGWFLVLAPGRFRLLSDTDVERDEKLSNVRSQIIDGPTGLDSASPVEFESSARAAVLGRLVPVSIDSSFRIVVPKEVLPAEQDRWAFVLLFSMGYLEIWLANIYNDALACPLYSAL